MSSSDRRFDKDLDGQLPPLEPKNQGVGIKPEIVRFPTLREALLKATVKK